MDNVSIIGIDISKRSFQLHGATDSGIPVLRKKLSRSKMVEFFASQPPCLVVMEACGGAHYWGREIQQFGHEVRWREQNRDWSDRIRRHACSPHLASVVDNIRYSLQRV